MKLAAIDIGSNAIRLQIVNVFEEEHMVSFKRLQFLRFPLRLGKVVFSKGVIEESTIEKFKKLMLTFKYLMDLYEVDAYRAVATSAMREAKNGELIRLLMKKKVGINIDIISGSKEAKIINKAMVPYLNDNYHIHIDVGGGSTELNFYNNSKLIWSQSFKIGSVRKMTKQQRKNKFLEIRSWIRDIKWDKDIEITGIGTGGNINKLFKLSGEKYENVISLVELKAMRAYVKAFSKEDRMSILKLNPDRADVIVPASKIYIKVLELFGCNHIIVPRVGLKDGLILELYEDISKKSVDQVAYI